MGQSWAMSFEGDQGQRTCGLSPGCEEIPRRNPSSELTFSRLLGKNKLDGGRRVGKAGKRGWQVAVEVEINNIFTSRVLRIY